MIGSLARDGVGKGYDPIGTNVTLPPCIADVVCVIAGDVSEENWGGGELDGVGGGGRCVYGGTEIRRVVYGSGACACA